MILSAGFAGAAPAEVDFLEPHTVQVEVMRRGNQWTAEYTFDTFMMIQQRNGKLAPTQG